MFFLGPPIKWDIVWKKNNENVRDCTKIEPLSLLWIGGSNGIGFEEFIYKSIVPATFMAPMKSTFNLADAQTILVGSFCLVFYIEILFLVMPTFFTMH